MPQLHAGLNRTKQSLFLNCDEVKMIAPGAEVRYAIELKVPADAPTQVNFSWRLNTPTGPFVGAGVGITG